MIDKQQLISTLDRLYRECNKTDKYDEIIKILEGIKINNLVRFYINVNDKYDSEDKVIIEYIILILQAIYNNSGIVPPITDEDYDSLYEIHLSETQTNIVGADNSNNREISNHRYPDLRGTLDKVHFFTKNEKGKDKRKSIEEWGDSLENRLGRPLHDDELTAYAFPKFDGVSIIFECDKNGNVLRALTRGNTKNNEAVVVTRLFQHLKFAPYEGWDSEFGVKSEVIVTHDNFKEFTKKYGEFKSPRSVASSIINSLEFDPFLLKYISVIPLRMQNYDTKEVVVHPDAFKVFPSMNTKLNDYDDLKSITTNIKEYMKTMMHVPIDGIVLVLTNTKLQEALGRDEAINKYEVAYKFTPDSVKTTLLDVEFCIGVLGSITPVAKIEPVKMEGNTISNVSLGSIDRFESLHLHKGDEVLITYDIIPYLYIDDTCERSTKSVIQSPTHCMYCGEKLINDPILRCVNNECPSRVIGKIVNYIDKMNIENISIGIVTKLFNEGFVKCIEDLYRIEDMKSRISELDGLGSKSVNRIVKGIEKRKNVYDYNVLGAIGIPDIGQRIFKKILNVYRLDELLTLAEQNDIKSLTSIYGIQEKTANKIIVGLLMNKSLIKYLQKVLFINHDSKEYKMKVVFTKVRDKDFEKYLDSKDIEVCSSYNKDIDLVICDNDMSGSDKVNKAVKAGKKVMTIKEAYTFFKYK